MAFRIANVSNTIDRLYMVELYTASNGYQLIWFPRNNVLLAKYLSFSTPFIDLELEVTNASMFQLLYFENDELGLINTLEEKLG
ncbi:MAG TPA: hypothetical protein VJB89_03540 [Candidatus Nanoarchaeia archaeon]|nr:hypothetical protein [Candidatus Nanoarchaeia archaeon]